MDALGAVEVQALIEIGPEYPDRIPIFHISFVHIPTTLVPESVSFRVRSFIGFCVFPVPSPAL